MQVLIKVFIAVVLPFSMFGQLNFIKHYSNEGFDAGNGVLQMADSSYVICGISSSFDNGPSQAFLLKVDSTGNYIWSNNYGGFESESAERVVHYPGFGFLMAGYTNSIGEGGYDFYLAKADEQGTLEWERTYGGSGWEKVNDAAMTADSGIIMVGESNSNPATGNDWFIVRADKNGDTLWTKQIQETGNGTATCIERYQDSLYVIGGNYWFEDSLTTQTRLIYMKEDGQIIAELDNNLLSGSWEINDITISNDTIHGIGAYSDSINDFSDFSLYSARLTTTDVIGIGYFKGLDAGDFWGENIQAYRNGSRRYATIGHDNNINSFDFGSDLLISTYNADLSFLGSVVAINGNYPDNSGQIIETSDGGAAIVGLRGSVGESHSAVYLLKIGEEENYPVVNGATFYDDLVSVDEIVKMIDAKLYPNPASLSFTIEIEEGEEHEILLIDALGQVVKTTSIFGSQTIDVSSLSSGFYSVVINEGGNTVGSYRLIIQ